MNSDNFLNFVTAATPGGIEQQEAQGQQELLRSSTLPKKCDDWDLLKSWGIEITGEADDLFFNVNLPVGWTKKATEHSMHSDLLDDRGLKRAGIFYKAAFYDRSADVSPFKNRFVLRTDYQKDPEDGLVFHVFDIGLNRFVKRCQWGAYAYLESDESVVGFLVNEIFHCQPIGKNDKALFAKALYAVSNEGSIAVAISNDLFYKKYHHVNSCYEVIDAAKNTAISEANEFIAKIPLAYQWEPAFDFPEV